MQVELFLDVEAQKEHIESFLWYEKKQKGLGERYLEAIESTLYEISKHPLHYPKKRKAYREAGVPTFPFVIVYEILNSRNLIYVAAIFHTSRNPKLKYRKFKQ